VEIMISKKAVDWFKDEIGVKQGEQIRFYIQFYGSSPIQEGYSLTFSRDNAIDKAASTEVDGIVFYVEESDLWFFDGHNLYVDFNENGDELEFRYIKH
jgi:uncharacterized protein YneR